MAKNRALRTLCRIRAQVGTENLSESCSRDGCLVCMTDVPFPRIVVDVDLASRTPEIAGKRCDYILYFTRSDCDTLVMVPIELKSGGVNASTASTASKQLQRGVELAEHFMRNRINVRSVCHPVLFHGKHIHEKIRKALNRAKVEFRGRQLTIKTARCGQPRNLANVLAGEIG